MHSIYSFERARTAADLLARPRRYSFRTDDRNMMRERAAQQANKAKTKANRKRSKQARKLNKRAQKRG